MTSVGTLLTGLFVFAKGIAIAAPAMPEFSSDGTVQNADNYPDSRNMIYRHFVDVAKMTSRVRGVEKKNTPLGELRRMALCVVRARNIFGSQWRVRFVG